MLGSLSAVTMPVAVTATRYSDSYDLLHAAIAIPLGLALGLGALGAARSARRLDELTLGRAGGARAARIGSVLGVLGICLASSALVSVAVYGILTYVGNRE